jgi:hypothetical protein
VALNAAHAQQRTLEAEQHARDVRSAAAALAEKDRTVARTKFLREHKQKNDSLVGAAREEAQREKQRGEMERREREMRARAGPGRMIGASSTSTIFGVGVSEASTHAMQKRRQSHQEN